jgi:hypothetical protein
MAEHDRPRREPLLPEDGDKRSTRQPGDRSVPTPGQMGATPEETPGPGKPLVFPEHPQEG